MAVPVDLTREELRHAVEVGVNRQMRAIDAGLQDAHGKTGEGFGSHIQGAAAERAVAKLLGIRWSPGPALDGKTGDVGPHQVRSTERLNGKLIVHPACRDDATFFLVVGTAPSLIVVGAILGRRAKDARFWLTPPAVPSAAYFVPQAELDAA